jgi:hypothetical protein
VIATERIDAGLMIGTGEDSVDMCAIDSESFVDRSLYPREFFPTVKPSANARLIGEDRNGNICAITSGNRLRYTRQHADPGSIPDVTRILIHDPIAIEQ